MTALADHIAAVRAIVSEAGEIDAANALAAAVRRLSRDLPQTLTVDLVIADGPRAPLPAEWPAHATVSLVERLPVTVVPSAVRLYRLDPPWLLFDGAEVAAGDQVRVAYRASYVLDETTCTVPEDLDEALQAKAAAALLRARATATAGDESTTLSADTVDHGSISDRYARRAREQEAIYAQAISSRKVAPFASTQVLPRFRRLLRSMRR